MRLWHPDDFDALVPMMQAFLAATYATGDDVKPTPANARTFVTMGMNNQTPSIVAIEDGLAVGFHLCLYVDPGVEVREKVLQSCALYVCPNYRGRGIPAAMIRATADVAAPLGFARMDGCVLTDRTNDIFTKVGFKTRGQMFTWRIS